jgi:N-acetylglucosaminyldiphosphoundecaprenol N-acetyl-beta-D-mannosaminyltransferase
VTDRIEILGVPIDNLSVAESLQRIEEFIRSGRVHQHVVWMSRRQHGGAL